MAKLFQCTGLYLEVVKTVWSVFLQFDYEPYNTDSSPLKI